MHGRPERITQETPQSRRQPLRPLTRELPGPLRDFVLALRALHDDIGLSFSELAGRLPVSRSTLSRHLRGETVPDEQLLGLWCALSPEGEDRLPELLALLGRASSEEFEGSERSEGSEENGARPSSPPASGSLGTPGTPGTPGMPEAPGVPGAAGPSEIREDMYASLDAQGAQRAPGARSSAQFADTAGAEQVARRRRRLRFSLSLLLGSGATAALCTAATMYLMQSPGGEPERVTVHNVVRQCRAEAAHPRSPLCSMGLAEDPYLPYRQANTGGRVWGEDVLWADCRITDGVSVTDETGSHSTIWYRVEWDGAHLWLPGIRISPRQLNSPSVPLCER